MSRGKSIDQVAFGEPGHESREPAAGRSDGRARRWLVVAVSVVATAAVAAVALLVEYAVLASPDEPTGPQRILPEVAPPAVGGRYRFADTSAGSPVRYDPCRSIRIVVDDRLMPGGAAGLAEDAVARVVAATGLDLRLTGTTRAGPRRLRSLWSAERAARPAPVRLAWTTPRQEPALRGDATGVGRSAVAQVRGRARYVTGSVSLDAPALRNLLSLPGGRALVRAAIMRELAHLVGLADVNDPAELLHRHNLGLVEFGPGDREGLALLGQGRCL